MFGQIDLTQLYSAPWAKNVVKKNQLDVDVIVFFSRLCCDSAPRRAAFIYVLFKYSQRLATLGEIYFYVLQVRKIDILVRHYYNMFVTLKKISHSLHSRR
jgi:hypothetical protein